MYLCVPKCVYSTISMQELAEVGEDIRFSVTAVTDGYGSLPRPGSFATASSTSKHGTISSALYFI